MSLYLGSLLEEKKNNITLIRLAAAICVIYGHASVITGDGKVDFFLKFVGYKFIGGVAVDVFFVLSGFLICASIMNGKGVRYYIVSRVLRIFPALIVCVGLTSFVLGPLLTTHEDYWGASVWQYFWVNSMAYKTEYFLPGVFQSLNDQAVNGSLWSLPVEVRMYVFILIVYLMGLLSSRSLFNYSFFAIIISAYFEPTLYQSVVMHDSHIHVVGMFLVGAFYWVNRASIPINAWVAFSLIMVAALFHGTPKFSIAYMFVLPYLVFFLSFVGNVEWSKKIGDYSYGIYLYGWPVQQTMELVFPGQGSYFNTVISTLVAISIGAMSWHFIEKPAMSLKSNLTIYEWSRVIGMFGKVRGNA